MTRQALCILSPDCAAWEHQPLPSNFLLTTSLRAAGKSIPSRGPCIIPLLGLPESRSKEALHKLRWQRECALTATLTQRHPHTEPHTCICRAASRGCLLHQLLQGRLADNCPQR